MVRLIIVLYLLQSIAAFSQVSPHSTGATNPVSEETNLTCNNWLHLPSQPSYVNIGDLDMPGTALTIECNFNSSLNNNGFGDLVSKHVGSSDCNYLLRAYSGEITTSNGFFQAVTLCPVQQNKNYHVAMVYDGSSLKFYRNGFLLKQVPASGTLVLNNWQTWIGFYQPQILNENFIGYINEVRIWNVARNQAEINQYMNSSLPSPTTQPGLVAYYTFDNLQNKQGNPAWNGALGGSAIINAPVPTCTFIPDSCGVTTQMSCDTWLNLPSQPSYVNIGDLDISGSTITVEANFNSTLNNNGFGDLVSKHQGASDVNYLLRAYSGEITTTNGYFKALTLCPTEPNRTYHAAMVYDGSTLKFYRDGFLLNQVPASGSLVLNNWQTWIGFYQAQSLPENFIGYINEVRIWNVARTQAQINQYMFSPLPNPGTQSGLVAYYSFDNLLNKQGNPAWNGTLGGSAVINATSTDCGFVRDSCGPVIINQYTPVTALDRCKNTITVENASAFNPGDTVVMIQMKGASIDSSNTAGFGNVVNQNGSGNYEFNYVKSKTGNLIELLNRIERQYDVPIGKVQLIRVPYFTNLKVYGTITCLPWDGSKGGVVVAVAQDSIVLNSNIDVSGLGFRGGGDPPTSPSVFFCNESNYYYPADPTLASEKGEGNATISAAKSFGRGKLASGGGGGNSHNSGGGGGGNGGAGGSGGYQLEATPCNVIVPFDNRGVAGGGYSYSTAANKVFMGGGGGAGHSNNPELFEAVGGNGAGIIIIKANRLKTNGFKLVANGANAKTCGTTGSGCHEGMGGGGAGGTVLMNIGSFLDNTAVETKGGNGANMTAAGFAKVGPGGGGGGGVLWISNPSLPAGISVTNTGGSNGVATAYSNDPWGSTPGSNGNSLFNLQIPFASTLFRPNIDSVRIKDSMTACNAYNLNGLGYTNTNPIASWQWYFGDGGTANTQNTSHTYSLAGVFIVKLVITDINGCKDSITRNVTSSFLTMDAGPNSLICGSTPTILQATHTGGVTFSWTPTTFLSNPSVLNPVASPPATIMYYLTVTNSVGCSQRDSVLLTVMPKPAATASKSNDISCDTPYSQLLASGGTYYYWSPPGSLNNILIHNPLAGPDTSTTYTVIVSDESGCSDTASIRVNVNKNVQGLYPMPSAFTPNGDGLNDCFGIKNWGVVQKIEFSIYNRRGARIFYTTNPNACWDGTYRGRKQDSGVFVYMITAKNDCNEKIFRKGTVALIR